MIVTVLRMNLGNGGFANAVMAFERAVRAVDEDAVRSAHRELLDAFRTVSQAEARAAGPQLAALLDGVPHDLRAHIAVMVGACVERGADAVTCAPPVLANLAEALDEAREFAEYWAAAEGGELPDPASIEPTDFYDGAGVAATLSWWTLDHWIRASLTLMQREAVRRGLTRSTRELLTRRHEAYAKLCGDWRKDLAYALLVLDDEPVVVLHRETGSGYLVRMTGIGDNFQLHTLLADVLIGGGYLPGDAPSAAAAAVCRTVEGRVITRGSLNLVAPDGTWLWNEGTPSDIPVVEGTRMLVLDPPPYLRDWQAGRYFPAMAGELVLERVLPKAEAARWFAHVEPSKDPIETADA